MVVGEILIKIMGTLVVTIVVIVAVKLELVQELPVSKQKPLG